MKATSYLTGLLLVTLCGCSGMNNTESGLLGGTAVGAGLGTLVGLAAHAPVAGAVVGGVLGGAVGASAGADQDHRDYRNAQVQAAVNAQARNQMALSDIVQMSQRGVNENIIVRQMDATGSIFSLSADDILWLKQQGVSDRIVAEMQARRTRQVVVQQPVVVAPYYYESPPPAVRVGVRF